MTDPTDKYLARTLVESHNRHANSLDDLKTSLDIQGRALIQLRQKHNDLKPYQLELKYKLAIVASLILSLISLIIKL